MIARAYSVHRKQSWLLPTRLLHITRTDENQIPAVLILITSLNLVSRCVSGVQHPARANSVGARLARESAGLNNLFVISGRPLLGAANLIGGAAEVGSVLTAGSLLFRQK
jgi:hypothetical protein